MTLLNIVTENPVVTVLVLLVVLVPSMIFHVPSETKEVKKVLNNLVKSNKE